MFKVYLRSIRLIMSIYIFPFFFGVLPNRIYHWWAVFTRSRNPHASYSQYDFKWHFVGSIFQWYFTWNYIIAPCIYGVNRFVWNRKRDLMAAFSKYDRDSDGRISIEEAYLFLSQAPFNCSKEKVLTTMLTTYNNHSNNTKTALVQRVFQNARRYISYLWVKNHQKIISFESHILRGMVTPNFGHLF